jgi:hypothetical protein
VINGVHLLENMKLDETSRHGTIDELTAAEKINCWYVSRLLRLTLLAPAVVEAVLDGRQLEEMTLPQLLRPFPLEWAEQSDKLIAQPGLRPA